MPSADVGLTMPPLTLDERFNILEQVNETTDSRISQLEIMCSRLLTRIVNLERENTDLKNKTDHMDTLDTQISETFKHITSFEKTRDEHDKAIRDHDMHIVSHKNRLDDLVHKHESL